MQEASRLGACLKIREDESGLEATRRFLCLRTADSNLTLELEASISGVCCILPRIQRMASFGRLAPTIFSVLMELNGRRLRIPQANPSEMLLACELIRTGPSGLLERDLACCV